MKSDNIRVSTSGEGVKEALAQTEAIAKVKGLSSQDCLKLTLLAEEMLGMLQGLTGELEAIYSIEEEDNSYQLHLTTDTEMYSQKRQRLIDASSDNRNDAAVGIMGKLRCLLESILEPKDANTPKVSSLGIFGSMADPVGGGAALWSLSEYRDKVRAAEDAAEEWDELEKSIVANIAEDIRVGIKGNTVEMTISKKF